MERKMISTEELEQVTGGSIIFNEDCTTCGRNSNNQYKVNNLDAILSYYKENRGKMPEKQMMTNMLALGYISNL